MKHLGNVVFGRQRLEIALLDDLAHACTKFWVLCHLILKRDIPLLRVREPLQYVPVGRATAWTKTGSARECSCYITKSTFMPRHNSVPNSWIANRDDSLPVLVVEHVRSYAHLQTQHLSKIETPSGS